jgi:hypothetical protein
MGAIGRVPPPAPCANAIVEPRAKNLVRAIMGKLLHAVSFLIVRKTTNDAVSKRRNFSLQQDLTGGTAFGVQAT